MSATGVRDWASVDFYELLGVAPGATDTEIAQAFRARAKELHPDATADPGTTEQFKDVAAAYAVLSDHRRRKDYDRVRVAVLKPVPPVVRQPGPSAPKRVVPSPSRWSRRKAWNAVIIGAIVAVLGVGAAIVTWTLHDNDATRRARFTPVVAERVADRDITFRTRTGQTIRTREPIQHGEGTGTGPTVHVRYDPANPVHVIVDAGTFGRDITLAVVALKLIVGGLAFVGMGRVAPAPERECYSRSMIVTLA